MKRTSIKQFLVVFVLLVSFWGDSLASHIFSADLSYEYQGSGNYLFTLVTYTDPTGGQVDRCLADFSVYDLNGYVVDEIEDVPRINGDSVDSQFSIPCQISPSPPVGEYVSGYRKRNIYQFTYQFPGQGSFLVVYTDHARIDGINNLPNSQSTAASVECFVRNDGSLRSSPVFTSMPLEDLCGPERWEFDPGLIYTENDSIHISFYDPQSGHNYPTPGYTSPLNIGGMAGDSLYVNPKTGKIIWNQPRQNGYYLFGIKAETFCNGNLISSTQREFCLLVANCTNQAPGILAPDSVRVNPGDSVIVPFWVVRHDRQDSLFFHWARTGWPAGSAFETSGDSAKLHFRYLAGEEMVFPPFSLSTDSFPGVLKWPTLSFYGRKEPYTLILEAHDNPGYAHYNSGTIQRRDQHVIYVYIDDPNPVPVSCPNPIPPSPLQTYLNQNYPNPAYWRTTIPFSVSDSVSVAEILIFDSMGRHIYSFPIEERGPSELVLDVHSTYFYPNAPHFLARGIYFVSLRADGELIETRSMVVGD